MTHPTTQDWNAAAATYDDGPDHGLLDPGVRRAWLALLRSHLPPAPADVVDLGCGTGTLSVLLAQEGYRVRGIDTAHEMVHAARYKATDADVCATFELGDADHPAYPPGSCDVVLVRHVLWALPDPAEAIGRWVTLLRPGGRLVLVEGSWHTGGGISVSDCEQALRRHRSTVVIEHLNDENLWGGPVPDQRYLALSTA